MGDFLGLLAGCGMLILIGVLIVAFLRQIGVLRPKTCGIVGESALTVLAIGCAYWAVGALINQIKFNNLDSIAHMEAFFRGEYAQRMFRALSQPEWVGPLSGLSAWAGHLLGKVLFGNSILGGLMFSWFLTFLGVVLLRLRLTAVWDEKTAKDAVFLLLCLPGAVFFYLPGWLSVAFLGAALLFFFVGKRIGNHRMTYASPAYGWILAVSSIFSTAVVTGCVLGKLG